MAYLMAGLGSSSLNSRKPVIIAGNGVVVLNALLSTTLLVDFHQRQRRWIVLH